MEYLPEEKVSVQSKATEISENPKAKEGNKENLSNMPVRDDQKDSSSNLNKIPPENEPCQKNDAATEIFNCGIVDDSENIKINTTHDSPMEEDNHIMQILPSCVKVQSEYADSGLEDEMEKDILEQTHNKPTNEGNNVSNEYLINIPFKLDTEAPSPLESVTAQNIMTITDATENTNETEGTAKSIAEATAIVESSISSNVSSPATTSVISGIPTTASSIYHVKWVGACHMDKNTKDNMSDASECSNSNQGGKTAIVTQNENGPCPLLSIVNVLLLQRKFSLPDSCEVISADQLLEYIG